MTSLITDHVDRALALLPQQFKGKPRIEGFLRAVIEPLQELENVFIDLFLLRSINTATGAQLDRLGKIVGQPRAGEDDDLYRRYVRARISVNRSNGTIPDLLRITRLIIDDEDATIIAAPYYPAGIVIRITDHEVDEDLAALLLSFLSSARAGGVRLIVETSGVLPAAAFSFAGGPGLGFGEGAFTRARART